MAGNLRQLALQAKSIKNIQKLTSSMKMVAATRLRQAEKQLYAARPLGAGARVFYDLFSRSVEPKSKKFYLVPFTSDRGLCGPCHSRTCKKTLIAVDGKFDYSIVCVGEKARQLIGFRRPKLISLVVNGIGHRNPTFKSASKIATELLNQDNFVNGTFLYQRFITSLSFGVNHMPVHSYDALKQSTFILKYELSGTVEAESYVEFTIAALTFHALTESYSVELFSRMNAMSTASSNAKSMHSRLVGAYNRARQNLVTRELIDIVSGASVVAGKKKKRVNLSAIASVK